MTVERRSSDVRLAIIEREVQDIARLRQDVDALRSLVSEMTGVVSALRIASLLVGLVIAIYTLSQIVTRV